MTWTRLLPMLLASIGGIGGCTERSAPTPESRVTARWELKGATRLRDIDTRPSRFPSPFPSAGGVGAVFTTPSGVTYLSLNDGMHGWELWRSDGTESGTVLVKDIYPGLSSSELGGFVEAGGQVFFVARSDFAETGLWKTDGTEAGTVRVKRFRAESGHVDYGLRSIAPAGTRVVFTYQGQLWGTDGTEAGTVLLKQSPHPFLGGALHTLGDRAFFLLNNNTSEGVELWRTDGTEAGTARVHEVAPPGTGEKLNSLMARAGGSLWFTVHHALWKTDGTQTGTVLVDEQSGAIERLIPTSGRLFFFRNGQLWANDGTTTAPLLDRDTTRGVQQFTPVGGVLYFTRTSEDATLPELWKSDGTVAGTAPVGDVWPGAARGLPERLVGWNGQLVFVAATTDGRAGLWKSDGTPGGTVVVKDWPSKWPLEESVARLWPKRAGPRLLFGVPDAQGTEEVWRTDGTTAETARLEGVRPGTEGSGVQRVPFGVVDGKVLFAAGDGDSGWGLWGSDGTEAGTVLLHRFVTRTETDIPREQLLALVGSRLFFTANDGERGRELWMSDGTEAGTVLLRDILPGAESSIPLDLTELGGVLYFTADDGVGGRYLWKSDGTEAGTVPVSDGSRIVGLNPELLTLLNGALYFTTYAGSGQSLWKSDGTAAGTDRVVGFGGGSVYMMTAGGGSLYFARNEGERESLWKSDGTEAGTELLMEVTGVLTELKWVGTRLYFGVIRHDSANIEVWASDGTAAGTVRLVDPGRGLTPSYAVHFERLGDRVFFLAGDAEHGHELWKTDGTPAGTERVMDLWPGPASGVPVDLRQVVAPLRMVPLEELGLLLFVGRDAEAGVEPWVTDGTAEGTWRLVDLLPGPASSHPGGFARVGDRVFFFAGDPEVGREPFVLPLPERNAPQLTCPANVQATTATADGNPVEYPAATVSDASGTPEVSYSQASGSHFLLGTTVVEVTATDVFGNQSRCSFSVEVIQDSVIAPYPESGCGCASGMAPGASAGWGLLLLLGASLRRRRVH
ncbi:ELWxxDGT repeat protein [Pyxidicoccus sp. 3LG]